MSPNLASNTMFFGMARTISHLDSQSKKQSMQMKVYDFMPKITNTLINMLGIPFKLSCHALKIFTILSVSALFAFSHNTYAFMARPVEIQLGPWGYKQYGPLCRSSGAGARGASARLKYYPAPSSESNFLWALLETRAPGIYPGYPPSRRYCSWPL